MPTPLKRLFEVPYLFLFGVAIIGIIAFRDFASTFQKNPKEFIGFYLCIATLVGLLLYGIFGSIGNRFLIGLYVCVAIGALFLMAFNPHDWLEILIFGEGGAVLVIVTLILPPKRSIDEKDRPQL